MKENFKQRIGKEEYMSQRIKRENITQKRIVVSDSV